MNLQFILDNKGNTMMFSEWQKTVLDDRLNAYYQSNDFEDFNKTIQDIEGARGLPVGDPY